MERGRCLITGNYFLVERVVKIADQLLNHKVKSQHCFSDLAYYTSVPLHTNYFSLCMRTSNDTKQKNCTPADATFILQKQQSTYGCFAVT